MGCGNSGDEELGAIGSYRIANTISWVFYIYNMYAVEGGLKAMLTGTSVGHAKQERAFVLEFEVLVLELGAVDTFAASAISCSEITTLDHELLDDSVEGAALVVERLASLPYALLASA